MQVVSTEWNIMVRTGSYEPRISTGNSITAPCLHLGVPGGFIKENNTYFMKKKLSSYCFVTIK
jgi:hypothetical protein